MKIFLPPLEISDNEGFSPDKDFFGRKEFGDGLTRLITNVDDPLVIALDGQWGSGKTTFLKMWAGELRKQSYPVVFFDAFANDYMSDAFLAIAGQIIALAEEKKKSDSPQTKEFVIKAKRAGKVLLRSSLKIGLKAATLGALDGDELDGVTKDLIKDIAKEASDLEDKYIGELLTRQAQEKDAIEQFKSALGQLSESLAEETQTGENSAQKLKKPLVFIVDELDRCRPDFALSLLERIKHFFLVDNVHVVIGVNFQQLYSSVRLCYGHDVDADYYLQKFFHLKLEINHELGYAQSAEKIYKIPYRSA
jgi:predicted KAP-like P-loop ATPase